MIVGLSKTTFNSSVCTIKGDEVEINLTERQSRQKGSGKWPMERLEEIKDEDISCVIENRDSSSVKSYEDSIDKKSPLYLLIQKKGLKRFSQKFNEEIIELSHHYAHALVAKYMSPFEEALILVRDGAGSKIEDVRRLENIDKDHCSAPEQSNEMVSLYSLKDGKLKCLEKHYQQFSWLDDLSISNGIGILYEAVAEYIFNNKRAAGKVMGLAPFGDYKGELNQDAILEELSKGKRFVGKSKADWESSENLEHYKNLASLMQKTFEKESFDFLKKVKERHPNFDNLILTGGTALNCTFNMKLSDSGIFRDIYVPPFPGDECISLGCALHEYYKSNEFKVRKRLDQHGYFGPKVNIPNEQRVKEIFKEYDCRTFSNIAEKAAEVLSGGEVIAWYQGRSESGPRSLGNRSILAPLNFPNLKNYLNENIKFRESFRPYGASFTHESAANYFEINDNFFSHFMSYSLKVRPEHIEVLKEVTHIDGTSRAQTVTPNQNPLFHEMLKVLGKKTGVPGVLNTSLNIMGEPIVESLDDLKKFFDQSKIKTLFVGNTMVTKND